MRRELMTGLSFTFIAAMGAIWANGDPPATRIADAPGQLMKSKLVCSQSALAGLLRNDFDMIASQARKMKQISEAAEWPRSRDSVYEHYSAIFRRQCNQLEAQAKQSNREGTKFTYLQMTTTCIQCHEYVRDSLRVTERKGGSVQLIPAHWPIDHSRQDAKRKP